MIYEPAEDSYLLQKYVKTYSKNKKVLDMGSGSGIQAETALGNGAKSVLAVEIDEQSISFIKKKNIPVVKSNLFSKVNGKFDLIVFNPPYLPRDEREDRESRKATTGGKRGDEIILKFLNQSLKHLEKNGVILLLLSSLTPRDKINSFLKKNRMTQRTIGKKKIFMERLEVLRITSS